MRARLALLAAVTLSLLLAGCVGSGSYGDGGTDSSDAGTFDEDDLLVEEPDIPAGFSDAGVGIAFRFADDPVCDGSVRCSQVEVYAYQDCPSMVYIEANLIDGDDRVVGYANDTLGSLSEGQTGLMTLAFTESDGQAVSITEINCY